MKLAYLCLEFRLFQRFTSEEKPISLINCSAMLPTPVAWKEIMTMNFRSVYQPNFGLFWRYRRSDKKKLIPRFTPPKTIFCPANCDHALSLTTWIPKASEMLMKIQPLATRLSN
jgi:hypothetical protein